MESYQALAREVHARNMFLIQDIVTNHVGNFFTYDDPYSYDPSLPCQGFRLIKMHCPPGKNCRTHST
ncbi:alpha-amylase family glycosyl hydrolase [Vibrio parahaemolyticus]|nr:alpha-amylase family glycosyl hydrolase [Vibrio parahaemolyticus]MDN4720170.1 alpha-amylase family glycosyl hydrolase [Vibrio parahaemolyticus]MDN4726972.1 alpha-amylase family glycosyl hydrolase [Vibrio parahaemolyticus]